MKPVIWGMIGCGDVTEVKNGPGLYLAEHSVLKGVYNRTASKAESWVSRHGHGIVYESAEELLKDPEIEIVYIATTPDTHTRYALMCAEARKHCLIEKPVAPTLKEGERIQEAFRRADRRCYVAFYRRQLNRFIQIHQIVRSGRIGQIRGVQILRLTAPLKDPHAWRANPAICGGNVFTETDIHALDILTMLMGPAEKITCSRSRTGYAASLQFSGGRIASGFWDYESEIQTDRFEILGSRGRIAFDFFNNAAPVCIWDGQGYEEMIVEDSVHVGMAMEQEIVRELRGEGRFSGTIESALESLKIADQIYYEKV